MPAIQRGTLRKRDKSWLARYYDENGARRERGGFATKSEAGEWLGAKVRSVEALRRGEVSAVRRLTMPTLAELVEEYVEQHAAEANTLRTLRARLRYATEGPALDGSGGFGSLRIDRLTVPELGAWRKRLPERSAYAITKALRQVLAYAVRVKLVDENVAKLVPNPEPKRREVPSFETMEDIEAAAVELGPTFGAIPIVGALTGLRPEEWIALERRDVDRAGQVLHVRRVFTDGQVKLYGKQTRSLRTVPLPLRASQALAELPARVDTPLLFPGERGGHLSLHNWRRDHWTPAVKAAGLEHRTPYALRHSYASFAIAAGVSLFELARFMGTSVEQIDRTYRHLLPDALDRTRDALDTFLAVSNVAVRRRSQTRNAEPLDGVVSRPLEAELEGKPL
jgi:integrase